MRLGFSLQCGCLAFQDCAPAYRWPLVPCRTTHLECALRGPVADAMKSISTKHDSPQPVTDTAVYLFDDWFDPIEACVRERVREFIGAMIEGELDATLLRPRYERLPKNAASAPAAVGHRHGHRARSLIGTFGRTEIEVPRARLNGPEGNTTEWNS